jgi:flagellar biosynthesis chaperone FliJ
MQQEQKLACKAPVDMEELKQALEDVHDQLKMMGEERNQYQNQIKWVLALP